MPDPNPLTVPLTEIQAGVFDPLVLAHEVHLFVQITNGEGARTFLRSITDQVTTEAEAATMGGADHEWRLSLGFTWAGLGALGVSTGVLASFPEEFRDSMAARSVILGDNGVNAP